MAKKNNVNENAEVTAANEVTSAPADAATTTEAAAPAAPKVDRRIKLITKPDGTNIPRTDYIRELWSSGKHDRSSIRDHLNNDCSSPDGEAHKVVYQIVNAAVDGLTGGPSAEFLAEKEQRKAAAKAETAAKRAAEKAAAKPAESAAPAGEPASADVAGDAPETGDFVA